MQPRQTARDCTMRACPVPGSRSFALPVRDFETVLVVDDVEFVVMA